VPFWAAREICGEILKSSLRNVEEGYRKTEGIDGGGEIMAVLLYRYGV